MSNNNNGEGEEFNMNMQKLINIVFDNIAKSNIEEDQVRTYPESILQQTQNGNKYYNAFQGHNKQFIDESNTQGEVVRWPNSVIQITLKSIIDSWQAVDVKGIMNDPAENEEDKVNKKAILSTANTLFSWSSGDSYIESRKRELQHRNERTDTPMASHTNSQATKERSDEEKKTYLKEDELLKSLHIEPPKESITNKLNRIVDRESNKFIHRRIQLIKAHHSEQISKEIHERKRKDHELHLIKLKQKEEEYEKRLQAATSDQGKQNKFFGSLFGFSAGTTANSHNESIEEKDHKNPVQNVASSPSGRNKRFSFLPGANISLWGHTGTPNKNTKLLREREEGEVEVSLNIQLPNKHAHQEVAQAPTSPINQNDNVEGLLKSNKGQIKEAERKPKIIEEVSAENTKKDAEIGSEHEAEEEEDEFEEFSSSIPNISINLDPIQPKINHINDLSHNIDNLLDL